MNDDALGRLPAIRDAGSPRLPSHYRRPPMWTAAGQQDRQLEAAHIVRMRSLQREAIEAVAVQVKETAAELARLERRARVLTENKYALHRAHKESLILGAGDPILAAKYAVLDDDFFGQVRADGK